MIRRLATLVASAVLAATAVALASPEPAPAEAASFSSGPSDLVLHYQAYVAGAPVGEATIEVTLRDGAYRVRGDARARGLMKRFSGWRNRFTARGRLEGPDLEPAEFAYTERDADKHRHVVVRDGFLQVTKNGRQRPRRPSPEGADVVSALFVQPHCTDQRVLHTGRHVYRLSRIESFVNGCRFSVMDDDEDVFQVELELARRGGLAVPVRITVHAWVTGSIRLMDAVTVDGSSRTEDTAPLQLGE